MGKLDEFLVTSADILRTAFGTSKKEIFTSAIIVAGGHSSRMGGNVTKQMMLISGIPVVAHTLIAFEQSERISEIVVAAKEDEIPLYHNFAVKYGITKLSSVVAGGETRQESVLNAFNVTSPKAKYVAVHDGARCLITTKEIEKVLDAAIKYGAATAAVRTVDTVKIADKNGFIERTEDRNYVWNAQTPQIFGRNLYCAAAVTAKEAGFEATDDNSLVERIGYKVKLVECSKENIKITRPCDIKTAERIMLDRKEAKESEKCSE